jgi:hypothetical protein
LAGAGQDFDGACGSIDADSVAGVQATGRVVGVDDARDFEFAGYHGSVAEHSAEVDDQCC